MWSKSHHLLWYLPVMVQTIDHDIFQSESYIVLPMRSNDWHVDGFVWDFSKVDRIQLSDLHATDETKSIMLLLKLLTEGICKLVRSWLLETFLSLVDRILLVRDDRPNTILINNRFTSLAFFTSEISYCKSRMCHLCRPHWYWSLWERSWSKQGIHSIELFQLFLFWNNIKIVNRYLIRRGKKSRGGKEQIISGNQLRKGGKRVLMVPYFENTINDYLCFS